MEWIKSMIPGGISGSGQSTSLHLYLEPGLGVDQTRLGYSTWWCRLNLTLHQLAHVRAGSEDLPGEVF